MHRLIVCLRSIAVLTGCAPAILAIALCNQTACADEPGVQLPQELTGQPGILVMRNGKVVEGRILKTGDDYSVQSPQGGIMFVPGSLVSLHCQNLREAYRKLRENAQKQNSAAAHCALARWCITNKMTKDARTELSDALELDPLHEEARNLLRRLTEQPDSELPKEGKTKPASTTSAPKSPRFVAEEVESLGALPREYAQHFTRRIQPILVNNCAVAGCHAADSETGFRLQRVVPGNDTSRIASERNLAEVLEQIDIQSPRSSPLLTISRRNHGRRGKPTFSGARGSEQFDELNRWVRSVARSEAARERRDGTTPHKEDRIEQTSGTADAAETKTPPRRTLKGATPDDSRGATLTRTPSDPFHVNRDPFDPEQFNKSAGSKGARR